MKPFPIKNVLTLALLALFALATSCSKNEGGGGAKKNSDTPPLTDDPGPIDDCFGLQEEEIEETVDGDETLPGEEAEAEPLSSGSDPCGETPTDDGTDTSTPGSKTAGPKYKECNDQNKAWIPVSDSGAYCGDPLVSWCCSQGTIEARFAVHTNPSEGRDLKGDMSAIIESGLKLYHCSKTADGKNYFHFAIKEAGKTRYKNIWVSGGETEVADPATCPVVTDADMGFTSTTTDGEENTDGEEDGGEDIDGEVDDGDEIDDGDEEGGEDDAELEIDDGEVTI